MQLKTKKYGGDPLRTYKVLMRKLSKEGHYQEVKEKELYSKQLENHFHQCQGIHVHFVCRFSRLA